MIELFYGERGAGKGYGFLNGEQHNIPAGLTGFLKYNAETERKPSVRYTRVGDDQYALIHMNFLAGTDLDRRNQFFADCILLNGKEADELFKKPESIFFVSFRDNPKAGEARKHFQEMFEADTESDVQHIEENPEAEECYKTYLYACVQDKVKVFHLYKEKCPYEMLSSYLMLLPEELRKEVSFAFNPKGSAETAPYTLLFMETSDYGALVKNPSSGGTMERRIVIRDGQVTNPPNDGSLQKRWSMLTCSFLAEHKKEFSNFREMYKALGEEYKAKEEKNKKKNKKSKKEKKTGETKGGKRSKKSVTKKGKVLKLLPYVCITVLAALALVLYAFRGSQMEISQEIVIRVTGDWITFLLQLVTVLSMSKTIDKWKEGVRDAVVDVESE